MKPVVTWVVLADARRARVLENRGPGKGLAEVAGRTWTAETPDHPRDKPGVGHSIAGPGIAAVEGKHPELEVETRFARTLSDAMRAARDAGDFDRLIVVAGPRMLGLLRDAFDDRLKRAVVGEIPKDLIARTSADVAAHIGDIIAV